MTLQSSGAISFSNINSELGIGSSYSSDLNFLNNYIKSSQRPSPPNMSGFYSKAYYQKNNDGNCNNGNCSTASSSGNRQCQNCTLNTLANCVNCDSQPWLQSDCNCACVYNCAQNANQTFNCDCDCQCNCFWSDPALKTNMDPITNPLDMVQALSGFFYEGNEQASRLGLDTRRTVGLDAEQIKKVLPEALGPLMQGYKTVRYERLIPVLLEAIKELDRRTSDSTSNKQG